MSLCFAVGAQDHSKNESELLKTDRKRFVENLLKDAEDDFTKSKLIIKWVVSNFDWTITDYQKRTVQEIIERGGGNCNELSLLTRSLLKEANINTRTIREINLQKQNVERGLTAERKVLEMGNRLSVFGENHNDHVWLEVYDDETGSYQPLDPSLGIVGLDEWMEARMIYEERNLLNPAANDMIVPIGIFVADEKGSLVENRSMYYLVEKFADYYKQRFLNSTEWEEWKESINNISIKCSEAFNGSYNLHKSNDVILRLKNIYLNLGAYYKNSIR